VGHTFAGGDQCWRFEASAGHLCSRSVLSDKRGEVDGMENVEKGRQADRGEVWVVTGGDGGCMISLLGENKFFRYFS